MFLISNWKKKTLTKKLHLFEHKINFLKKTKKVREETTPIIPFTFSPLRAIDKEILFHPQNKQILKQRFFGARMLHKEREREEKRKKYLALEDPASLL